MRMSRRPRGCCFMPCCPTSRTSTTWVGGCTRSAARWAVRRSGCKGGTHLFFPARTRSTLRGWSVDRYLADEAQLLTDEQWESRQAGDVGARATRRCGCSAPRLNAR